MKPKISVEKKKEPNAVEEIFSKKFGELQCHPMSEENTKFMITLIFSEMDPKFNEELKNLVKKDKMCQLLTKRLAWLGYTADERSIMFLSVVTNGAPGIGVMYSHYIAYWLKTKKLSHLTFDEFCKNVFPMGYPSEQDMIKLWDKQKVEDGSNLLDHLEASQSIRGDI